MSMHPKQQEMINQAAVDLLRFLYDDNGYWGGYHRFTKNKEGTELLAKAFALRAAVNAVSITALVPGCELPGVISEIKSLGGEILETTRRSK